MMKKIISLILMLFHIVVVGQSANQNLKEGNQLYEENKFDEAEIKYRKSLAASKDNSEKAEFNLGDALYKQERYEEAVEQFTKVASQTQNKKLKAKALHNLGNSLLKQEKLKEAIDAYKSSLKLNPHDEETRYNLAQSLKKMQQQQQQQQNKDNQDKNKDEKSEDEKNDKKDKKENGDEDADKDDSQEPKDEDGDNNNPDEKGGSKEDPNKKPKPIPGQISREDAQRLLDVVNKEEQKLQKELNKKKVKGQPVNSEKDW